MILKIIGAAAILAGAGGLGFRKALEYRQKIDRLSELERMTEYFRGEIVFHNSALSEACEDIAKQVTEPLSSFLKRVAEKIERKTGEELKTIWTTEAKAVMRELSMDEKEREEFIRLGEKLGYLGRDMQEKTLNRYRAFLEKRRNGLEEEQKEKTKLYQTLGILGGLFLILLLL